MPESPPNPEETAVSASPAPQQPDGPSQPAEPQPPQTQQPDVVVVPQWLAVLAPIIDQLFGPRLSEVAGTYMKSKSKAAVHEAWIRFFNGLLSTATAVFVIYLVAEILEKVILKVLELVASKQLTGGEGTAMLAVLASMLALALNRKSPAA